MDRTHLFSASYLLVQHHKIRRNKIRTSLFSHKLSQIRILRYAQYTYVENDRRQLPINTDSTIFSVQASPKKRSVGILCSLQRVVLATKMRGEIKVKDNHHTLSRSVTRFATFLSFINLSRCISASSLVIVPPDAYVQIISSNSEGRAVPPVKRAEIADIKANIVGLLHLRICIGTSEVVKTFIFARPRRANPW